jgi:hypothetical protein
VEPTDLLRFIATALERLGLRYLVTGSTATTAYGTPRLTNDIDVVVDVPATRVAEFCAAFPESEFYLSADAVAQAVAQRGQFNILHPKSGLKIDVMVASESEFDRSRLQRGRRLSVFPDLSVTFASPEDVMLKKMEYYQQGGSEKHLRDIAGVLQTRGPQIDYGYMAEWSARLGLSEVWESIRNRLQDIDS